YSVSLGEKGDRISYPWQVAVGYNGFFDRRSNSYRFIASNIDNVQLRTVIVDIDNPQQTYNDYIMRGAFHFKEETNENDYRSHLYQFINAGYVNLNFKPNDSWDILVGGRVENNLNITRYKEQSDKEYN